MSRTTSPATSGKAALVLGFCALLAAVVIARRAPATGYELSIYAATPVGYWAGVAVALLIAVVVAVVAADHRSVRDAAVLLGTLSVTSVVALPLVRGYYYFGAGDSLTHLGWMRDILAGRLDPFGLLYPGIHTSAVFVSEVVGIRLGNAQLLLVVAFVLAFVTFVSLCVGLLGRTRWALPIGAVAGLLFLPTNNIGILLVSHPSSQSLMMLPFVLYLAFHYVRGPADDGTRFVGLAPIGVLLSLSMVALVLIHPQGALNAILVFATISGVQFLARRSDSHRIIEAHRPLYVPTIVGAVAFALWAPRFERVAGAVLSVVTGLLSGSATTEEITTRTTSLAELGGSVPELFAKLFLVDTLFLGLSGLVMLAIYAGWFSPGRATDRRTLLGYLGVAMVPLGALFALVFVVLSSTQHFRYLGFLMVPATIAGAVAIDEGTGVVRDAVGDGRGALVLIVVVFLLFPLPLATLHPSPFIYQPTQDVTRSQIDGMERTVERMDRSIAFAGLRSGPDREIDAIYGTERAETLDIDGTTDQAAIPPAVFESNMTGYYNDSRYFPVAASDYQREAVLFRGLRYSERGFDRLDATAGINHIQSNGGYDLYLVENESAR